MTNTPELHPVLQFWRDRHHPDPPVPEPTYRQDGTVVWPPEPLSRGGEPVELPDERPAWQSVTKIWSHRYRINPVEAGNILNWLDQQDVSDLKPEKQAERLGRRPSRVWCETLRETVDLPENLREKLDAGDLSLRVIRYLRELPEAWKSELYQQMANDEFHLSVQETRQLVEASHRWSPPGDDQWLRLLADSTGSKPRDRGIAFLERVKREVYPTIHQKNQEFQQELEQLEIDHRIDVQPPDNFEGDRLTFTIRCGRNQPLEQLAEELKRCQPLFKHI